MELNIKSYRGFIIKVLLPFFISITLSIVCIGICVVLSLMDKNEGIVIIIYFAVLDVLVLSCLLLAKFYNKKLYIFNNEKIKAYKKGQMINEINICDIESINYRSFKFRYIITIFFGELIDGGAWKLFIKKKNGEKLSLSFFSKSDAQKIATLYGDVFNII